MYKHHVDSLDENFWCDLVDYSSLLDDVASLQDDLCLNHHQPQSQNNIARSDSEHPRKRDESGRIGTKSGRERMRREKLNDRFSELSSILEPQRPAKNEKSAILCDAIRILNQLKAESHEYAETNQRLLEEIHNLKSEKNELRGEKTMLKAEKERLEQLLKTTSVCPTGFVPAHQPVYNPEANKLHIMPTYGFIPMWHYLPPSTHNTFQDHELRPPAA